jgi:hypothetical protein
MLFDYREYLKEIVYPYHIRETFDEDVDFKKNITKISIGFCILSVLYYVAKIVIYA